MFRITSFPLWYLVQFSPYFSRSRRVKFQEQASKSNAPSAGSRAANCRLEIGFQWRKARRVVAPWGSGSRVSGPMWAGQVWGPSHSRISPLADNLFHCFARLGVSAFRTISRAKSRARRMSLRAPRNDHIRAPWTRMRGPCTGPFGPIPSLRMSRPIPPRTNLVFAPRL